MVYADQELQVLMSCGKEQGFLTYDQVNEYLPDEAVNPEKLDILLAALDEVGIELVHEAPDDEFEDKPGEENKEIDTSQTVANDGKAIVADDLPKLSDDPLRMYLAQMSQIGLLTREEEISLAKKIEVTRRRFRRGVLACNYSMQQTVETLTKVYNGQLPFDRTIKVSLTECLTKEQVLARMPHNLRTLQHLLDESRKDFSLLIRRSTPPDMRRAARRRFLRRRVKMLQLVEELSLRTRRVQPQMRQLEETSRRMDQIQERLRQLRNDASADRERTALRHELYSLMMLTLESPRSLRSRCRVVRRQFHEYEQVKRQLWQQLQRELRASGDPRVEGKDPWQGMTYRQTIGFGATFNASLSEAERRLARERASHKPE